MEYFRARFVAYLDTDFPVVIAGQTFPTADVFSQMAKHDFEAHFVGWMADKKGEAKDRAREFLTRYGSLQRFQTMMVRHSNRNVLPFIGAGMSRGSGFPLWGPFLLSLLDEAPETRAEVEADLALGNYEEGAQRALDSLGLEPFAEQIHNAMGRHIRGASGPVCLLPNLFTAEVLTTNFDYVLDHVYASADADFVEKFRGSQLLQAVQRLGNDPHCLLRLHGEADTHEDRVLTQGEYDRTYGDLAGFSRTFGRLVGTRSLLFLGSSLTSDRTFNALCSMKADAGEFPTRHYAFLPFPGEAKRKARSDQLAQASIYPIYYPPDEHDSAIEDLFITMMEGGF